MHMQNLWRALGALVLGGAVGCTVPDSMLKLRSDGGSDAIDLKGVDLAIGVGQIGADRRELQEVPDQGEPHLGLVAHQHR